MIDAPYILSDGTPIHFAFVADCEAENRGWVVHRLTACAGGAWAGDEVGYLKAMYIPSANVPVFYPDPYAAVSYAVRIQGIAHGVLDDLVARDWESVAKRLNRYAQLHDFPSKPIGGEYPDIGAAQWERLAHTALRRLQERYRSEYQEFLAYEVDRPKVDYIFVEDSLGGQLGRNWRRQGIGMELYQRMSVELHRRFGLNLYASTTQSPAAQAAWHRIRGTLPCGAEPNPHHSPGSPAPAHRTYIDGAKLAATIVTAA